jgi:hypothetical protein
MYAAVFETPYERDLKSYVFKYKVLKYMYQFEESSDLKIIGTGIAPQFAPGDQECSPQDHCSSGFICKDGSCTSKKVYAEKDPNDYRIAVYDDEGKHWDDGGYLGSGYYVENQDQLETYDADLNWVGVKNNDLAFGTKDIAVGEFDLDAGGQEIVIIDHNDREGARVDDLEFLHKADSKFYEKDKHHTSYSDLKVINAGDLDLLKPGDEIIVLNYPGSVTKIIVFDSNGNEITQFGTGAQIADLAIGDFYPDIPGDEFAFVYAMNAAYNVIEIWQLKNGELNLIDSIDLNGDYLVTAASNVLVAGDFDPTHSGDELIFVERQWDTKRSLASVDTNGDDRCGTGDLTNYCVWDGRDKLHFFSVTTEVWSEYTTPITITNSDGSGIGSIDAGNIDIDYEGDELVLLIWNWAPVVCYKPSISYWKYNGGNDELWLFKLENGEYTIKDTADTQNKDFKRIAVFDILPSEVKTTIRNEIEEENKPYKSLYCCGATLPKDIDNPEGQLVEFNEWFPDKCPDYAPWYQLESECWSYAYDERCPNTAPWDRSLTCDKGIERPITCADNRDCLGGAICDLDAVATEGVGECRVYRCNQNYDNFKDPIYLEKTKSKIGSDYVSKCRMPESKINMLQYKNENKEIITAPDWVMDFEHFTGADISYYEKYIPPPIEE